MKTVITKAEYAALKQRGPSAVSNWIAEGRISKEALVGEGNRARIWVERADADLARNLDPGQQASQAVPVSPALVPVPIEDGSNVVELRSATANRAAADDEDVRRRRKADADKAEHDAEAARRRLAVDEGRWIDAAEAQREWGRALAKIVADTETFLTNTLARSIAEVHGLDWKALSVEIRNLYRQHRTEVAEGAERIVETQEAAE